MCTSRGVHGVSKGLGWCAPKKGIPVPVFQWEVDRSPWGIVGHVQPEEDGCACVVCRCVMCAQHKAQMASFEKMCRALDSLGLNSRSAYCLHIQRT